MSVSLWQDAAVWAAPAAERREECDVCVVGAGIVGAYLARFLGEAGQRVVVLEARDVAAGASGRNAGHCSVGLKTSYHRAVAGLGRAVAREVRDLQIRNRRIVAEDLARHGVPHERPGSLALAIDAREAGELAASAAALRADGYSVELYDRDPLGRGFAGAIYQPDDMAIQPVLLTEAVLAASGATVITNCAVRAIEPAGDELIVRARRATVRARRVALATNAYSPLIDPYFIGKVLPMRGQMLATAPGPRLIDMPMGADDGYEYWRQLPDGRFAIGGCRNRHQAEEVGYTEATTPALQADLQAFLGRHFPELDGRPIEHRWAGIMGFTPDAVPLVGSLPGRPAISFAVGFTGHGIGFGPVTAERCVAYMLEGAHPGPLDATRLD